MYPGANKRGVSRVITNPGRIVKYLWILIVLLIAGQACTLPSLGPQKTAQLIPTAVPTIAIVPEEPKTVLPTQVAPLPPALVEVVPLSQTELAPGIAPVFYFNQPMDRASVEASLEIQPPLAARYEWLDDSTLRLIPDQPVNAEVSLNFTINAKARAVNGLAMLQPVQVDYRAVESLRVVERLPQPDGEDVNPSSAVAVTFNRPIVPLGAEPAGLTPAFTIEPLPGLPPVSGRGEWLNTSTYIFYPEPVLYGGTQYTVQMNPNLTAFDGSPLPADQVDQEWSFRTAAPAILSLKPGAEQPVQLDDVFVLGFNQPMEKTSVEADFSLTRADGSAVTGSFLWNETATEVTFKPANLLERDTGLGLVLFGSARSQGGAALGQDFAVSLVTVPQFAVTQTRPAAGDLLDSSFGFSTVTLTFSTPIAVGQDLNSLIRINPAINGQSAVRSFDGSEIYLNGYFQPSTSYDLEIGKDLSDRWGSVLGLPYTFTFSTVAARPSITLPGSQLEGRTVFVPYGETSLAANSTNIERLALSRGSLSLSDFILAESSYQGLQGWEPLVKSTWVRLLYPNLNTRERIDIPLHEADELLEPGLYFLKVDTQPVLEDGADTSPALLVVSPIQLTFKTSLRQAFVWAVQLAGREPLAGASVMIYDQTARSVAECVTDSNGICQAGLPLTDALDGSYYAVIGQPGDPNFSLASFDWAQGVSPWELSMSYQKESPDPQVYLYTDRPVYRPGQAVNLRAVVRNQENGRFSPANMNELTVDVVGAYDPVTSQTQVLTSLRLALDDFGAASGVYVLPEDASPGEYTLRVQEVKFQEIYFKVAEYRKPEIDLQVKFGQADRLYGQDVQAQVNARYYFGAPAGNAVIRWTLFAAPGYPDLPNGFLSGKADTGWMNDRSIFGMAGFYITEGQQTTAPDGSLAIQIPGDLIRERLSAQSGQLLRLTLEVTVEDESGLPVSARDRMNLHPSPYYIGVRPEMWAVTAGEEITYSIQTLDWPGNPVADLPLSAHFSKVTWTQQDTGDPNTPPEYKMEVVEVGSTDFSTSENGEARLAFLPAAPGTFMVEITGKDGALTQVLIWVGGIGSAAWPNLPNQRLLLRSSAQEYAPGDTAKVFIPNPFEDGALALVTVERGQVMRSQVMNISGASLELELPLSDADAPNIYVSVTLLGRSSGRPDFRVGYIELQVKPTAYLLQLQLNINPAQVEPGEEVTLTLRARDARGEPVQGEFSLALVDKAVLALADPNAPEIEEAFYSRQDLGVQSSYSLATYAGRMLYLPPGRGGGGGEALPGFSLRETFEDTAFWNGAIRTDVTGAAQLTIPLPDNLTTWQADVRGLTLDTLVGSVRSDLVTSKPLLVRPVAPRFVVLGDHLELAAVVHNNTQDSLRVSVRLEGAGFTLDDPNLAVQPVDVPAGGRQRVSWWGTVQDAPALDLVFGADAGPLHDATRPETGLLPVMRYIVPQTFGTSGVLSAPGSRLELVSIPRSFTPAGGELRLDLSPSLAAVIVDGLKALDEFPRETNEPAISRLLPNLLMYSALRDFQLENDPRLNEMKDAVAGSVGYLSARQNEDGGWGWAAGSSSSAYLSGYVLFGLARASQAGVFVDPQILQKGQEYLVADLLEPQVETADWELDQLAFRLFVLQESGRSGLDINTLYNFRDRLSPWGKAFLALVLESAAPGDSKARTLLSDLQASALRSATGAHWQDPNPGWHSWSTLNFTTAVAAYAVARLDPASQVLPDAVRYLTLNRRPGGAWNSSYETAWVLAALVETARSTGDLQAQYVFSAAINDSPLMTGTVDGPAAALQPVSSALPLAALRPDVPNALKIDHGEGSGTLYYRAFLQVSRPAQDAPAISRGMTLSRQFYQSGQNCRSQSCLPVTGASLSDKQPLLVRLTLTVPQDMAYVVVEDQIPAGVEILNPRLKTSQQNIPTGEPLVGEETTPQLFDPADPFSQGWGWWLFQAPQVYTDRIRWIVEYLPAGTYELTYRVTPFLAGEFRVIPAHAYQNYFPEVEGYSAGGLLIIR